jgi:hypothetical protein
MMAAEGLSQRDWEGERERMRKAGQVSYLAYQAYVDRYGTKPERERARAIETVLGALTLVVPAGIEARIGAEVLAERGLRSGAEAARDALAKDLATRKHPPATVVGAYSRSQGRFTAQASRGGGRGCAEGVCKEALDHAADIKFTRAVRPRTGNWKEVCEVCEAQYGRNAFYDPDTEFGSDLPK